MRDRKYALSFAAILLLLLTIACSTEQPTTPQPAPPAQPTAGQPSTAPTSPTGPTGTETSTAGTATAEAMKPVYQKNCLPCHGADGKGTKTISPKMPDFTDAAWQAKEEDEELIGSVTNGIGTGKGSMPAWKGRLTEEEIKGLVAYVRTFAKK
jgi:mono/diheme cytochrome c family protein